MNKLSNLIYSCGGKTTFSTAITPASLHYLLEFGNTVNILEPLKEWLLKENV